jgi:hypothetical protein
MKDSTTRAVTWLDNYSIIREFGASKYAAQQWMDASSDSIQGALVQASREEMAAASDEARLRDKAIGRTVGDTVMAIGASVFTAVGATGVGAIVGAVIAAVGGIISGLTELFTVECDEWDCPWPKSFHRRGIVGVDIGRVDEGFHLLDDDKRCMYFHRRCTLYGYFHDGQMIDGISKDPDNPNVTGRVVGCNGSRVGKYSRPIRDAWMRHSSNPQDVPKGSIGSPWNDPPTTRAHRGWKVSWVLYWLRDKMPCRILSCMEEILKNTQRGDKDASKFDAQRRRGGRWYASIVWMMNDVWEIGQSIGSERFEQVLRSQGQDNAADVVKRIRTEQLVFEPEDLPFPFWPVMRHCSWEGLRKTLIAMKPMIPAEGPWAGTQPEGEQRRVVKVGLAPMMPRRVVPLIFDPKRLRPIPAKTGSRLPEWPVLVAGGAAAVIGAVAIFQALKKKD